MKNTLTIKKITSLTIVAIAALFFSLQASAASVTHKGQISRIYLAGNGAVYMKLKNKTQGCTPVHSNHYYILPAASPVFDTTYALLLAAAHAGTEISFRLDDIACTQSEYTSPLISVTQAF
ncbi:hypothetical protein NBRC116583_38340 [Arenicella sp. 4NH20-0111]|uniref:hypothetical protein n=1 Tax=Arenicella sp. 4NH20-0111 TaxID=3127648 RepID=UPI0031078386